MRLALLILQLAHGPYGVGFKGVALWDHTRTLGHGARPLSVSIWYPAAPKASAPRMRLREYAWLTTLPGQLPREGAAAHRAAERLLIDSIYPTTDTARVRQALDAFVSAVRDATPAPGRFPVIVYGPGRDNVSFDNSALMEALASHGYLVISSPSWGPDGPMPSGFEGIECQARDMEFLLAYARGLPDADTTRSAIMGYSWGGMSNILVAMRNSSVDAVVSLDGSIAYWYERRFKGGPFVDPDHLSAPFLILKQGDPGDLSSYGADSVFAFFPEIRRADAYLVKLPHANHHNFSSLHNALDTDDSASVYPRVAQYAIAFLDAELKGSREGAALLASVTTERRVRSTPGDSVWH
jgi:dienelactone hydrolase